MCLYQLNLAFVSRSPQQLNPDSIYLSIYHLISSDVFILYFVEAHKENTISFTSFKLCFLPSRSVGGLRVSLYNAVMSHEVNHLIEFMKSFQEKYHKTVDMK